MHKIACVLALGGALAFATPALATTFTGTVSTFGNTTGTGPWDLTSEVSPATYSGLEIDPTSSLTFADLASLSATFQDIAGGAFGGAPRFSIGLDNGSGVQYMHVVLGTSPNYNDSDPAAFTTDYSGFNVIGNNDAGRYDISQFGGSTFTTYATALAAVGSYTVKEIDLVLDGSWGANGRQEMLVSGLDVNGTDFNSTATPEPASLALLGAGLAGVGFMRRKKVA